MRVNGVAPQHECDGTRRVLAKAAICQGLQSIAARRLGAAGHFLRVLLARIREDSSCQVPSASDPSDYLSGMARDFT